MPRYDHVFMLVEENHGYGDIIGNPAAPTLNRLARAYGLACCGRSRACSVSRVWPGPATPRPSSR